MTTGPYRSSEAQIYLIRYGSLVLGLVGLGEWVRLLVTGQGTSAALWTWILPVLLLTLFRFSRGKFGVVTAEVAGLLVQQNGERFSAAWADVLNFDQVGFFMRPVYRLVFRHRATPTYFVPPAPAMLQLPLPFFDQSGMARFIRSRLPGGGVPTKAPARWRHDL